jgi:putative ABC transport system ATP-binding protein
MTAVIETKQLTKTYQMGDNIINALQGVDLKVDEGEFLALMGPSGSGKSTLLNLLGCLDSPTSGEYLLEGKVVSSLSSNEYASIRNEKLGFVFQNFNLLSRTTALDNVELPLVYNRTKKINNPKRLAVKALERVGLSDRLSHEPNQLSQGQQQRVAIARALVNTPSIILADEPTGNLDSHTSIDIMSLFQGLNNDGITFIMVTHDQEIAKYAKRIIHLRDGSILSDTVTKN